MKYVNQVVYVNNAQKINHAAFCNGHYGIVRASIGQISYTDFDYLLSFADQSIFNHGREYWYFMEDEITDDFPEEFKRNLL